MATKAMELDELKAELRYCLDNGMYGQRTGLALQWALEIVEALEEEQEEREVSP